jgi:serine/threonine/tyrosine protein kinase RAD53
MQTDEQTGAEIARQMCLAVAYLHSQGVCHRDLSQFLDYLSCSAQRTAEPDNVLMTNGDSPIIKISDFGLAKMVDAQTFLRTACGTPTYLGRRPLDSNVRLIILAAPEVVLQSGSSGYSFAVDAWSVGVIIYAILSNASPFDEDSQENLAERMRRRSPDMAMLSNMGISAAGARRESLFECSPDFGDRLRLCCEAHDNRPQETHDSWCVSMAGKPAHIDFPA